MLNKDVFSKFQPVNLVLGTQYKDTQYKDTLSKGVLSKDILNKGILSKGINYKCQVILKLGPYKLLILTGKSELQFGMVLRITCGDS